MNGIVCVDKKWGIGRDNKLLFQIPSDMEFFKEKTIGKCVIMGKNTLLSLPDSKPLPNRKNLIFSSSIEVNGCISCKDFTELVDQSGKFNSEDLFVIGGGELYRLLLPYCQYFYVTKVDEDGGADCYFPDLDKMNSWRLIEQSEWLESNGYQFSFCKYKNDEVYKFE